LLEDVGLCEVLVVQARRLRRSVSMNDCRRLVEEIAECPGVGENAGCLWVFSTGMFSYQVRGAGRFGSDKVGAWVQDGGVQIMAEQREKGRGWL
jgi:hypothetical protein